MQAAHAQVGVVKRLGLGVGDDLGQPIRPAAVAAFAVGVLEPLGARVADRHVTPESRHPTIVAPRATGAEQGPPEAACDSHRGLRRYPMPVAGTRVDPDVSQCRRVLSRGVAGSSGLTCLSAARWALSVASLTALAGVSLE